MTNVTEDFGSVHTFNDVFTREELDGIRALGDREQPREARVDYAPKEARQGSVAWIHEEWLAKRLRKITDEINERCYRFDLDSAWREPFQYAHYGVGDHFHWHVDMGPRTVAPRKLSMTLQLSNPTEYDGGELQMQLGSWTVTMPFKRGALIVFPSWTPHRVQPVTRGERRSLVVWAHGPHFR